MKKIFIWLSLLFKRQFKNPLLILLLLLIPITAFISLNTNSSTDKKRTYVAGLYIAGGESEFATNMVNSLVASDEIVRFVAYENENEMKLDLIRENIICGYVIPYNLKEVLSSANSSGCIKSYILPASTLQASINELVYAELIKLQGYQMMTDAMNLSPSFEGDKYANDAVKKYEYYLQGDEVFHINYEVYNVDGSLTKSDVPTTFQFPIREILSIMIFLSGLFGCVLFMRDREEGIFQTITGSFNIYLRVLYIIIPTFAFAISSLLAFAISGITINVSKELSVMLLYILLITVFCLILMLITRKSKVLSSCIPVILLCCLVFCPVFINVADYIPATKYIQRLFIPFYYLKMF